MNFPRLILIFVGLLFAWTLFAQPSPKSNRRAEALATQLRFDQNRGKPLRFFMSSRYMTGVDIRFGNLGEMDFQVVEDRGDSVLYQFDDGFIGVDPVGSSVSSDFGFEFDKATTDASGYVNSFTLTGYSSESTGQSAEVDLESNMGVEMGMQYFVVNRRNFRLGVVGSFGINDINADSNQLVQGDLYRQMATVLLENSQIVPVPGAAYSRSGGSGPVVNLNNGFAYDPNSRERVTQNVVGEGEIGVPSEVQGTYNLDGISTGLRAGLVTEFNLGRFWVQAGAGYSAVYTYSEFSSRQRLVNSNLGLQLDQENSIDGSEWFFGPYGEIRAGFRISPSSRIYIGAMYIQMEETFGQRVGGVTNQLALENPLLIEFGVNIDF